MKYRLFISVFLSLALISIAPSTVAQPEGLNYISQLKGKIQIKRLGWTTYQQANFGDLLTAGDLIRVDKGALATVVCSNLTVWSVPAGRETLLEVGCKGSGHSVLFRQDQKTGPTRAGENLSMPYLISPRNTALLGRRPVLRWNNINAAPYQVMVSGDEVEWSATVSQSQVVFPGDQQAIKPGFRYRVTVVAQDGKQTAQDDPVSFTFLDEQHVQQVQQEVQQIKQLTLEPAAQMFALALLYQHHNLKAEAIDLLEESSRKGIQTTTTAKLLGELYQQSGLLRLAKDQYLKALQLAKADNNVEGQGSLLKALGEVDERLGQLKEALGSYQISSRIYQTLGDAGQVRLLQAKINDLSKRVPRS
jgi:hypothetical protein